MSFYFNNIFASRAMCLFFFLLFVNVSYAANLDPNYKFAGVKAPESPCKNTWSDFQTNLFSGSFGYQYKIVAPSGTNGLAPDISISYNSHSAKGKAGWVGFGWDIPADYIQRDIEYTRKDTSDDTFDLYLNGAKHDLVFASSDGRYHTGIESYMKIENQSGAPNDLGEYWVVKTIDGTEFRFGYNQDSENIVATSDAEMTERYVWRWSLDRVRDANGNCIYFSYTENLANGEVYPKQIEYNNDKKRKIEFLLEDRPDSYLVIDQGSEVHETKRLKEIRITVDGSLARKYELAYAVSENQSRSLLTSVQQFGSDGISSLPPVQFEYQGLVKGFQTKFEWSIPCCNQYLLKNEEDGDQYYGTFDMNGDGLPDHVKYEDGDKRFSVRLNTKTGFRSSNEYWILTSKRDTVRYITDLRVEEGSATNTRSSFLDFNRDGIVDLLWANGENDPSDPEYRKLWIFENGQTDFIRFQEWTMPMAAWIRNVIRVEVDGGEPQNAPNVEQTFLDINGDGLPDLVTRAKKDGVEYDAWRIWRNTGQGFDGFGTWKVGHSPDNAWIEDFEKDDLDVEAMPIDMNGDGLVDIIWGKDAGDWRVYINTGSHFKHDGDWDPPGLNDDDIIDIEDHSDRDQANDVRRTLLDINGDGLPDIVHAQDDQNKHWDVYLNKGEGFTGQIDWPAPLDTDYLRDVFFDDEDRSMVRRDMLDLNGDGLPDVVHRSTDYHWDVYFNKSEQENLLVKITDTLGGVVEIDYGSSMQYDNTRLPLNFWVVESVSTDNGMEGSHQNAASTSYSYEAGMYDFPSREFRGFGKVYETLADGTQVVHCFHQTEGLKGKEYETETVGESNAPFAKMVDTWTDSLSEGVYAPRLDQRDGYTYDGQASDPKIIRTQYQNYDDYGNIGKEIHFGDISATGDELWHFKDFGYDTQSWIVDRLTHSLVKDSENGDTLRESWFQYDDNGNLIREEHGLDTGANPVTFREYDSFGNLIRTTDPLNRTTRKTFEEEFHTYPIELIDAKGHTTTRAYDPITGQVTAETDPNGISIEFEYDVFGRKTKEIRPFDDADHPTIKIGYSIDGVAPEGIDIKRRETSGADQTLDTYQFIDGFANLIQTKTEFELPDSQIVRDIFYDSMGRVAAQSNPYLTNSSSAYSSPEVDMWKTSYTYDALGRPTAIDNPDSSRIDRVFDHWKVTEIDENGHPTSYFFDSRKRLLQVTENNAGESYVTEYQYQPTGELVKIQDHLGNTTDIEYDSLGRKSRMDDPDMGTWRYEYDAVGNLTRQTDARGVETQISYDELNRQTLVDYPNDTDTQYVYDEGKIGTVSQIMDGSGEVQFEYDDRLRKVRELRTIDEFTWDTNWSYDAMDRVVSMIYPDGETVEYDYNDQGLLENIPGIVDDMSYDENGQLVRKTYSNGILTSYTYHPANRRLTSMQASGIQDFGYSYDPVGNILSISDGIRGDTEHFTYDDLDRLITAGDSEYTRAYSYNAIGNLLQETKDGEVHGYSYGESAGPHAVTGKTVPEPVIGSFFINGGDFFSTSQNVILDNYSAEVN